MKKSTPRFRAVDGKLEHDVLGQAEPQRTWKQMPEALRDVIEAERSRLMDAEAVLHCAVAALDASDHGSAIEPYYQSVINTARDLIVRSVSQLDMVALNETLSAVDAGAAISSRDEPMFVRVRKSAVRESALEYLN